MSDSSPRLYVSPDEVTVQGPFTAVELMRRVKEFKLPETVLVTMEGQPKNWMPFSETPCFTEAYSTVTRERRAAELAAVKAEQKPEPAKKEGPDGCGIGCATILIMILAWMIYHLPDLFGFINHSVDDAVKNLKYEGQRLREDADRQEKAHQIYDQQRDEFLKSRNIK